MKINLSAFQPVLDLPIHALPQSLVVRRRKVHVDFVSQLGLRHRKVPVPLRIRAQLELVPLRYSLAIDWNYLVLLVEELDVLGLPLLGSRLLLTKEDKAAVAVDIVCHAALVEAMGDGCLHLSNGSGTAVAEFSQSAAFTVHDEDAVLLALLGHFDEFVNRQGAAPG